MKLLHEVKDRVDATELLDGVSTIHDFCARVETIAKKCLTDDERNSHKGNLFELFVEYFINAQWCSPFVCTKDYKPLPSCTLPDGTVPSDYGIDGMGVSTINSKRVIVQAKYRSNSEYSLKYSGDHLANAITQAWLTGLLEGIDHNDPKPNILYITTAKDIGALTLQNAFLSKVRFLGRPELSRICDNQREFWLDFKQSIIDSRIAPAKTEVKTMRPHQEEAVATVLENVRVGVAKGQVILPTGTGKTLIMSRTILDLVNGNAPPAANNAAPVLSITDIETKVRDAKQEQRVEEIQKGIDMNQQA